MNTLTNMARAIVSFHAELALEPSQNIKLFMTLALKDKGLLAIKDDKPAASYQAAKMASLALDFIESDADCIARAWQAQTQRTGYFDAQSWPTEPADFGLRLRPQPSAEANRNANVRADADAPADAFPPCPRQLGLYAVLPDAAWVARMAHAGVPTVQLRFKSDDAQAITAEVHAAVQAVRGTQTLLFINDHWQAAIAAGAYGVHLGQEDLDHADLQAIRAAGLRLGLSSHGYAEMLRADQCRPSYIAMGAVFATTLKRMATPPQGLARLKVYARLLRDYPTVAIGGIDAARLPAAVVCGVGSVAVVRALVAAADPEMAAAQLLAQMRTAMQPPQEP